MQAISASWSTGGRTTQVCGTAAGTNASAILRKGPETAEVKTFFFYFALFVRLRNNKVIWARMSVFNMIFTQKDQ